MQTREENRQPTCERVVSKWVFSEGRLASQGGKNGLPESERPEQGEEITRPIGGK